jgi:hypothetical protein
LNNSHTQIRVQIGNHIRAITTIKQEVLLLKSTRKIFNFLDIILSN